MAPAPLLSDAEVLARAPTLPLEDRRYLVYLYARLNQPRLAERLADSVLTTHPTDRQTLLALASMYLEQRDAAKTLDLARRYLAAYPDDHQGLYFLGTGHFLAGDFREAASILGELKREQFPNRRYPYETDLAAAASAAGDWRQSILSYETLLAGDNLAPGFREEIRRTLQTLYRDHLPHVELSATQTRLDRADVWRTAASTALHVSDRHRLELRYTRDDVTLESAPGLRATRADRADLAANLNSEYDHRWRSDASIGISGEGALATARLQHVFGSQRLLALEVAVNVRATDSLALEALDGRQHHAALAGTWVLGNKLVAGARAHARELRLAGERFGRGAGVDWSLDRIFRIERPRLTVGYRGTVARFSAKDPFPPHVAAPIADPADDVATQESILRNLVSRRINRHGTGLTLTGNLADAWFYRLTAGVDYDFVLSHPGWNGALSLTFTPHRNVEFTVEAGHTSSATASNAGSAATLLSFVFRLYY